MNRKFPIIQETHFKSADRLWEALSPTRPLRIAPSRFVYRGQGKAHHKLVPSVLRDLDRAAAISPGSNTINATDMVFYEILLLRKFALHCDSLGIPIPGDSQAFRENHLTTQNADIYYIRPDRWPNPELLDLMAMAQHHGVPTRLLDWSNKPYVSAYFAASSAVSHFHNWSAQDRLAIWAMDLSKINLHTKIRIHRSPGATSRHLAAQDGLFTIQAHSGIRGGEFVTQGLEEQTDDLPEPLFLKLTLPVFESVRLLQLCSSAGFNAATMFQSADGAGKAVLDDINSFGALKRWNTDGIRVRGIN